MLDGAAAKDAGGRDAAMIDYLEDLRWAWERGNNYAVLQALARCRELNLDVPSWVLTAFHAAFARFANYECGTLDEAFGAPRHSKWTISEYARRQPAYYRVSRYVREGMTLEQAFELVAAEERDTGYPVGAEAVKKWYYKFNRQHKEACEKLGLKWHGG